MPPPRSLASPKVCGAGELDVPLHLYPQPLVCRLVGGREGCGCEVDKELPSQFLFFLAPTPAAPFNPISPCAHTLDFATAPGQGSLRGRPRVLPFEQRRTVQAWTQSTKPARHCSRATSPCGGLGPVCPTQPWLCCFEGFQGGLWGSRLTSGVLLSLSP